MAFGHSHVLPNQIRSQDNECIFLYTIATHPRFITILNEENKSSTNYFHYLSEDYVNLTIIWLEKAGILVLFCLQIESTIYDVRTEDDQSFFHFIDIS